MEYTLSKAQRTIYEMEKFGGDKVGTLSAELFFKSGISPEIVIDAVRKLLEICEELHIRILTNGAEPIQKKIKCDSYEPEKMYFDSEIDYSAWKKLQNDKPLNLSERLYRFFTVSIGEKTVLFYQIHRIICDYSSAVWIGNFIRSYIQNRKVPDYLPYTEYVEKENAYLLSEAALSDWDYWKKLYTLNPDTAYIKENQSINGSAARSIFVLNSLQKSNIKNYCISKGVSPLIVVMTGAAAYFKAALNKNAFYIGTTVSKREDGYGIGAFENTVPISVKVDEDTNFSDLTNIIKSSYNESVIHSNYAYIDLLKKLYEDFKQDSLYDITVNYFCFDDNDFGCLCMGQTENLSITIVEKSKEYSIVYDYKEDIFSASEIEYLNSHIMNLIFSGIESDKAVSALEMISQEENDLLCQFNNTEADYPKDKIVIDLFEEQVQKTPDSTAVIFYEDKLTYSELNSKSNLIAEKLRDIGVKPNDFVAVIADRSIEMIAGIYGIIKSGGAYVPIDPTYPDERISFILKDCTPKALLKYTNENINIPSEINIIDLKDEDVWEGSSENPEHVSKPDDLAYCIYTSGTTGRPKGVMIEHKNLYSYVVQFCDYFDVNEESVVLQQAYIGFDTSVEELYPALVKGGKIVSVSKEDLMHPKKMHRFIEKHKVSIISCSPLLIKEMDYIKNSSVKVLISGGDVLQHDYIEIFKDTGINIYNTYGPTESTVCASYYKVDWNDIQSNIPIGKPIANKKIYIMNKNRLCGIGIPGELCVAGDGLARGYLNRSELTEQKFVKNPFGEGRMYRSGDLARWLPDGNIEYLGRIDEQVKIRGFRIELGEIESKIRDIENIKDCAVIARKDSSGDKAIYAYYTSDSEISLSNIRKKLKANLPDYMIPAYMMQIEEIPITINGKLDKKALPKIEAKTAGNYIAPRNETEKKVCEIFSEILNVESVGIGDSFFELGGHSLRATRLLNKIEAETGVRISMKSVFAHDTPEQLAELVDRNVSEEYVPIPKAEKLEYYPMSSTQKRTYIVQQIQPESVAYNLPESMRLYGKVDSEAMKNAFRKMIDRHESLRTVFLMVDGEPVQKILKNAEVDFECFSSDKSDEELMRNFLRPFDLSKAPLLRAELIDKGEYNLFLIDMHHIISDGISIDIFIRELAELYNGKTLKPIFRQFKDYSEWMRNRDFRNQENFWKKTFSEEAPVLDIPTDYPRPQEQSFKGTRTRMMTDEKIISAIKRTAQNSGATEYMVLLSALMVMLSKYSRQEDIVIGSPISGRTHKDTESMLGMFVNTLAMRGRPEGEKTFSEFLHEIRGMCLRAYENQEYPFDELVNYLNIPRNPSRNPLFDVMLVLQNTEDTKIDFSGIKTEYIQNISVSAMFDLTFEIIESDNSYIIQLEYCTDLFSKETAERMLRHYVYILGQLTENSDKKLKTIEMVTDTERKQIINDFNSTALDYPKNKTIAELFEEQVNADPEKTALVFKDNKLTYKELNAKSNSLAHKLRELGVKPDDFVALISDKSIEMVAGIYGIIKSGGAYVPIDPAYPLERIKFMLEDCKPKAIVKYTKEKIKLPEGIPVIDLSDKNIWESSSENPKKVNTPNDLAYCIYTSGTTGKPKGVMIEHYGVANLREYFIQKQSVSANDNVIQFASAAFDATVSEMTMGLLCGACMHVLAPETQKDTEAFERYISENHISISILPPVYLTQVNLSGLRTIITAGSETNHDLVKKNSHIPIYSNDYGPTEVTVCATYWKHDSKDDIPLRIPIGKPINNKQVYIMNDGGLCGIGVPGELCIAGEGLARGYLNRPELTEQKFVNNPFGEGRMYRSGDLARWLPDGNIEYLGRIDEQVKIRGFRIELGEIESRIREIESIKDCAVVAKSDGSGDKAIYAYYTSDSKVIASDIRDELSKNLPEYMLPAYMMQIDEIPVTRNGKLDKKALPDVESSVTREYVAPRNDVEKAVCDTFGDVLKIERAGIHDRFIELGGDSIKAIRIISKLRALGYSVTVNEIMNGKTAENIADIIISKSGKNKYQQGEVSGKIKKIPAIRNFEKIKSEKFGCFNQAVILTVTGKKNDIIKNTFDFLIKYHDALRIVYRNNQAEILPISESRLFDFYEFDYSDVFDKKKAVEEKCNEIRAGIDLENGPIVKIAVFELGSEKVMMLCIHSIAVDELSWKIIAEDFNSVYNQLAENKEAKLPNKTASYIEWSKVLSDYGKGIENKPEYDYLKEIALQAKEVNFIDNFETDFHVGVSLSSFDSDITEKLFNEVNDVYHTVTSEILLTALEIALSRWSGHDRLSIGIESNQREKIDEKVDTNRTAGRFTVFYPMVLRNYDDIEQNIILTKETLRKIDNDKLAYSLLFADNDYLPDFYFSYSEQFRDYAVDINTNYFSGIFTVPENKLPGKICFNCQILKDILQIEIFYNYKDFDSLQIKELQNMYHDALRDVIGHCTGSQEEVTTISDLDTNDLSDDDMSSINDFLAALF